MASDEAIYTSSCLCGASKFSIHKLPQQMLLCHCENCQRWSGSAFATNVWFEEDAVKFEDTSKITQFTSNNTESGSPVNRHFCSGCGSNLYLTSPKIPGLISVTAGSIDGLLAGTRSNAKPPGSAFTTMEPLLEIFCRSKVPWMEVKAAAKQVEGAPAL